MWTYEQCHYMILIPLSTILHLLKGFELYNYYWNLPSPHNREDCFKVEMRDLRSYLLASCCPSTFKTTGLPFTPTLWASLDICASSLVLSPSFTLTSAWIPDSPWLQSWYLCLQPTWRLCWVKLPTGSWRPHGDSGINDIVTLAVTLCLM